MVRHCHLLLVSISIFLFCTKGFASDTVPEFSKKSHFQALENATDSLSYCHALNDLAEFYNNTWGPIIADSSQFFTFRAIELSRRLMDKSFPGAGREEIAALQNIALS